MTDTRHIDAIVVGSGPAGAAAALALGERGVETVVLERQEHPRPKPCGGGIPDAVFELRQDFDLRDVMQREVFQQRCLYNYERDVSFQTKTGILMFSRPELDEFLITEALRRGEGHVSLHQNEAVKQVEMSGDRVTVTTSKGRYSARYLIAADGANSVCGRALEPDRPPVEGVALDAEVRVPPEAFEAFAKEAVFNFGCVHAGYGWVFPKRETLSCGVGSWVKATGLRGTLTEFLDRTFADCGYEIVYFSGQAIPLYSPGDVALHTGRCFYVGDAARLVDPILGEGIRFALWSGFLAGSELADALDNAATGAGAQATNETPGSRYAAKVEAAFGEKFHILRALAFPDFVEAPSFFYKKFYEQRRAFWPHYKALAQRMKA